MIFKMRCTNTLIIYEHLACTFVGECNVWISWRGVKPDNQIFLFCMFIEKLGKNSKMYVLANHEFGMATVS